MPAHMVDYDFHRAQTMTTLNSLEDYCNTMKSALELAQRRDQARVVKRFGRLTSKKIDHLFPPLGEEGFGTVKIDKRVFDTWQAYEKHAKRFFEMPSQVRYSMMILIFIVFETRAKALCQELKRRRPHIPHTIECYRDGIVKRIKLFLGQEACRVSVPPNIWEEIECLQKVRNCLVHADGLITESDNQQFLQQLAKKKIGFSIDESGRAEIDFLLCRRMVKSVRAFFVSVFKCGAFGSATFKTRPVNKFPPELWDIYERIREDVPY